MWPFEFLYYFIYFLSIIITIFYRSHYSLTSPPIFFSFFFWFFHSEWVQFTVKSYHMCLVRLSLMALIIFHEIIQNRKLPCLKLSWFIGVILLELGKFYYYIVLCILLHILPNSFWVSCIYFWGSYLSNKWCTYDNFFICITCVCTVHLRENV